MLANLKTTLTEWRRDTRDPLLVEGNLARLHAEIRACFSNGKPDKSRLNLTYPGYFRNPEFPEAGPDRERGHPD